MKLERFEVPGLAHYSYVMQSKGSAAIVDPKRDIDSYLSYAAAHDLKIEKVLETHIHADFVSGATALADATGAELLLSGHDEGEQYEYGFPHTPLRDGQHFDLGDMRVVALHTPGHTPEHLSYLVYDRTRSVHMPVSLLSGDCVFVGSLGRPDLLGEEAKHALAARLYESVHEKLAGLPNGLEVRPAHGAGSLCGSAMAERPETTLGYERATSEFFRITDRQRFTERILSTVPPLPSYYPRMKRLNSDGPAILRQLPGVRELSLAEFRWAMASNGISVIDLRRPEAFGGAHIPGAFSIGGNQNLSLWAGWMVAPERPILLVGDEATDYEQARRSLIRVGLDDVRGHLKCGMRTWVEAGYEQAHVPQISAAELYERVQRGAYVLDVRTDNEWNAGHIEGAQHIMAGDLPKRTAEVPADKTVHTICGSGYRSSIAASVLLRAGLRDVVNVDGGMTAWYKRELPVVESEQARAA